jgi:hypothetical protein
MRRALAGGFLSLALLASGCGNKKAAEGSGPPVNFCEGFYSYNFFDEPKPDDPEEIDGYAGAMVRVIDRIKLTFKVEMPKGPPLRLPPTVGPDLKTVKTSMQRLRSEAKAANGDKALLRAAVNRAAEDEALNAADGRLVDFATTKCPPL